MRLNHARSFASTWIVGHVLGLGDRHTSNALVDNGSSEIVCIDLGIAFDQVRSWLFYITPFTDQNLGRALCRSPDGYYSG